jgi:hypothetical protein
VSTLKYIFAQPDFIEGIGNVYPIQLKDYEEFQQYSSILYLSKKHFGEENIPLLGLLFGYSQHLGFTYDSLTLTLEKLFSLVLRKKVYIYQTDDNFWFQTDDGLFSEYVSKIDFFNYEDLRSIIMKQNLIFEQKVYKNPKVQEWANKVLEARSKNGSNITIEDIISTVSVYKGVSYDDLQNYTLYQLYADFYRIRKMKKYDADVIFRSVSDKVTIEDFAEQVNLFKNPYDDLFVGKDKLSKLNKVFK